MNTDEHYRMDAADTACEWGFQPAPSDEATQAKDDYFPDQADVPQELEHPMVTARRIQWEESRTKNLPAQIVDENYTSWQNEKKKHTPVHDGQQATLSSIKKIAGLANSHASRKMESNARIATHALACHHCRRARQ